MLVSTDAGNTIGNADTAAPSAYWNAYPSTDASYLNDSINDEAGDAYLNFCLF